MNSDLTAEEINPILQNEFKILENSSTYCSMRIRKDNQTSKSLTLTNQRESSEMDIFVNQFIKPEIKNLETPPLQRLRRKISKKQLLFNLMVLGESGLGKKTFIHSIVNNNCIKKENLSTQFEEIEENIGNGLVSSSYSLIKENQKICLNIIQNHEYGSGLNSDSTFSNILEYIDGTFKECFKFECSLDRSSPDDRKIHCCLYFISPYGHSVKPLDIKFMKMFQTKLNIIPIIAKADTFTKTELQTFKTNILKDFEKNEINLFVYYTNCNLLEDNNEDIQDMCDELKENIPFTIVLSKDVLMNKKNKEEKIRQYSWGTVKTEDPEISQFLYLENLLLKSHINYFKTITKSVHYENYRVQFILQHVTKDRDGSNE